MIWEAYAIRYARHERTAQLCHAYPVADPHEAMPLDFFIWLLRAPDGHEIVVDTGYDPETAERRGRPLARFVTILVNLHRNRNSRFLRELFTPSSVMTRAHYAVRPKSLRESQEPWVTQLI